MWEKNLGMSCRSTFNLSLVSNQKKNGILNPRNRVLTLLQAHSYKPTPSYLRLQNRRKFRSSYPWYIISIHRKFFNDMAHPLVSSYLANVQFISDLGYCGGPLAVLAVRSLSWLNSSYSFSRSLLVVHADKPENQALIHDPDILGSFCCWWAWICDFARRSRAMRPHSAHTRKIGRTAGPCHRRVCQALLLSLCFRARRTHGCAHFRWPFILVIGCSIAQIWLLYR